MKKEFLRVTLVLICIVIMASCNSPKKDQVASTPADTVVHGAAISESSFARCPMALRFRFTI
jgi:hypothetical protein